MDKDIDEDDLRIKEMDDLENIVFKHMIKKRWTLDMSISYFGSKFISLIINSGLSKDEFLKFMNKEYDIFKNNQDKNL